MLNVYIADLTGLEESYDEKVNMLHRERADKLINYKMPADRTRCLGAGLLLEKGLEDYIKEQQLKTGMKDNTNPDISKEAAYIPRDEKGRCIICYAYGQQGKPYLKDYPDIHFSLSHSGNAAVLALSDSEVGIDVQEYRGYSERIAKRFYHEKEFKLLESVSEMKEKERLFYKIWTCKEAFIKYTGKGMGETLSSFYWDADAETIYKAVEVVNVYNVPMGNFNYQCSVVSGTNVKKIDKIIKIIL